MKYTNGNKISLKETREKWARVSSFTSLWHHKISRWPRTHAYQWPTGVICRCKWEKNHVQFTSFQADNQIFREENLEEGIRTLWTASSL